MRSTAHARPSSPRWAAVPGRAVRRSCCPSAAAARRRTKQLCPVPGCKNPAAPVFGMVCAKHKDVSKTQIAKYREARRAKKMKKPAGKRPGRPAKAAA